MVMFLGVYLRRENVGLQFIMQNTVSSQSTRVPISNLTSQPRIVRKGAVIASVAKAEQYLDTPRTRNELIAMQNGVERTSAIMQMGEEIENLRGRDVKTDHGRLRDAERPRRVFVVEEDGTTTIVRESPTTSALSVN